jgi:hypothetical protein
MAATRQSNRAAKPTAEYNEYKCCLPLELRGGAPPAFQFGSGAAQAVIDTKKNPSLGHKRVWDYGCLRSPPTRRAARCHLPPVHAAAATELLRAQPFTSATYGGAFQLGEEDRAAILNAERRSASL